MFSLNKNTKIKMAVEKDLDQPIPEGGNLGNSE